VKVVEYLTRRSFSKFKLSILLFIVTAFGGNWLFEYQTAEEGQARVALGQGDDEVYMVISLTVMAVIFVLVDYRFHRQNMKLR
jgi:sterol desaturase/sphingolipid hydroxylase (fatty acid hydroxylase superfamily)